MPLRLGREEMIIVGVPPGVVGVLGEMLPPDSVVIVEEPDALHRADRHRTLTDLPYVSRVVPAAYRTGLDTDALLAAEPGLAAARVVVPGLEYAVEAAADLAERLGRPGAGAPAARVFTDKHRMRETAAGCGLPNPAYALVRTPAEAEAFARRVGGRCVLKPTRRSGSLGVQLLDDPAEIAAAWAATAEPDGLAEGGPAASTEVLVEARLTGPEYSVELLVAEGRVVFGNVTDKRVLAGRYPVETGHTVPSRLPGPARRELVDVTTRLAAAAGFRTGVLHAEWIVADGVPTLVECAARLPGDLIAALISIAYESSFVEAYLRVLDGGRPTLPARAPAGAAVEFLIAPPGTVTAVDGVRAARRVPGVLDLRVAVATGDRVAEVVSSPQRSGYVLVWAAEPAEAEEAARRAAGLVRIAVT